jgi:hypothetical protein
MAEWDAAGLRWTQWDWFPGPRRADLGRVTRARTSSILLPQILRHHSVDAQRRDAMQRCRGMKAGDPEKAVQQLRALLYEAEGYRGDE